MGRGPLAGKGPWGFNSGSWDIDLTGIAVRAAYSNPAAFGTTGAVTGWQLPGLSAARLSADSMTGPRLVRVQDGSFEWAPHNLLLHHADMTQAAWVAYLATAPSATKVAEVAGGSVQARYQQATVTGDAASTYAVEASSDERTRAHISVSGSGAANHYWATFDLTAGTVLQSGAGASGVLVTATIGPGSAPGRWLCRVSGRTGQIGAHFAYVGPAVSDAPVVGSYGVLTYAGTAGSGIRAHAHRLHAGTVLQPMVPTTTAARYAPPVEHDGTAWGVRGEAAATNRVLWCRDLSNAAWTKSNATATLTATGIDGAANAASVVTATDANATVLQAITHTSTARALSMFLRRRTGTGTVETTINGGTTWVERTLTSAWQRFETSATLADPSVGVRIVTSGDAVDVDFVQPEDGAIATSPIPTFGAAVTRTVDNALVPGLAALTQGTVFVDATPADASNRGVFALNGGSDQNRIDLRSSGDVIVSAAGVLQANPSVGSFSTRAKVAIAFAENDIAACRDGGAVATDASATIPTVDRLLLGAVDANVAHINGAIRTLRLSRRRLSNAQIQALTL